VRLFIMGRKFSDAIDLCVAQKVKITDEFAEMLSPEVRRV
jgi:hypothetical protein